MKTQVKTFLAATALAFLALGASATDYVWKPNAADPNNILTNSCHTSVPWSTIEATPGANTVSVNINATTLPSAMKIVVTMPTDYETAVTPNFNVAGEKKLTYDSPYILRQRDLTAAERSAGRAYPNAAWAPKFNSLAIFYDAVGQYLDKKYGGWCFDNVKFTMDTAQANVIRFDLERGTMNFLDPNGTSLNGAYLWFLIDGAATTTCYFNLHEGSAIKVPHCLVYDTFGKAFVTIDGGRDHYFYTYEARDPNHKDELREHTLCVTGPDTRVQIDNLTFDKASTNHSFRAAFSNGAELVCSSLTGKKHSLKTYFVMDDAAVTLYSALNATLYATNTTFQPKTGPARFENCDFFAKNVQMGPYSTASFPGDVNIDWTDATLSSSNQVYFGTGSGESTMSFRNCVLTNSNQGITFGYWGDLRANVVIDNSAFYALTRPKCDYTSFTYAGERSSVDLDIRNGSTIAASHKVTALKGSSRLTLHDGCSVSANHLSMQEDANLGPVTNSYVQLGGTSTFHDWCSMCGVASTYLSLCEIIVSNGVFSARQIGGGANCSAKNPSNSGVAIVRLDGGRLVGTYAGADLVQTINHFYVGKGSPEIASDVAIGLSQSIENEPGESNEIVFTGKGTKTLSGAATTVSRIVVREGTVNFAAGSRATSTLVVEEGGTVAFGEDPSVIGFTGLELKGGTVKLASGQVLAINGNVTIESVRLNAACETAGEAVLITATGTADASSRQAWTKASNLAFVGAGTLSFDVIDESGLVKFRQIVQSPTYRIELHAGESNATANVTLPSDYAVLEVETDGGSVLTMKGTVRNGAITKLGDATVRLIDLALWQLTAGFYLRAGTFEYVGNDAEALFDRPFVFAAKNSTKTGLSVKTDSPLVLTNFTNVAGVIIKRGKAPLVFAPPSGTSVDLAPYDGSDAGAMDPASPVSFGDISSAAWVPPSDHATMGFNVLEGEVVFRGDSTTRIDASHSVILGSRATGVVVPAGLVIDGCKCKLGGAGNKFIEMAYQMAGGTTAVRNPYLYITNGAAVTSDTFILGRNPSDQTAGRVVIDHSTWTVASYRPGYNWKAKGYHYYRNQAAVYASEMPVYGAFYLYLDTGSILAKNASRAGVRFESNITSSDTRIVLSNESAVAFSILDDRVRTGRSATFDFASGTWWTSSAWQTFRTDRTASWRVNTLLDEGLTLPVEAGRTLYVALPFYGDGGVVKTGAGALEFETAGEWELYATYKTQTNKTALADSQTMKFFGPLDVREGSVKIWNTAGRVGETENPCTYKAATGASIDFDGAVLGVVKLVGGGAFAHATATDSTLGLTLKDDRTLEGHPTLTDVTLEGRTYVDFGRTTALDKSVIGLLVATFPNGAPDVSNWRARNPGGSSRVTFRIAENGTDVLADISRSGLVIIVR